MALVLDKRLILCCCAFSIISAANAIIVSGTFQVLMTIQEACTVTVGPTSNIILDPVNTTATSASASNTISINCSKTTSYFIGLTPSAANGGATAGSGAMSSVANAVTDTDKMPYQLNRTSTTGPAWENTATDIASGNGVTVTGAGLAQTYTVCATTPSTNFTPDDYTDTVTVNVNY